jgi:hypothetical protein
VPTVDLKKYTGVPITLTAPTWVTVGPTDFWNRNDGTTNLCGLLSNQPCALSNAGVFATGLTGKTSLDFWIPKRLGNWYVSCGTRDCIPLDSCAPVPWLCLGIKRPDLCGDLAQREVGHRHAFSLLRNPACLQSGLRPPVLGTIWYSRRKHVPSIQPTGGRTLWSPTRAS